MILDEIVAKKRETLTLEERDFKFKSWLATVSNVETGSFREALAKSGLSIIGEIKKASPSKGLIREDFDPVIIAKEYEGAVDCISVLTETHFFKGKKEYLAMVHETVATPLLRKDFFISPIQILEAKALGASCILLIVAILTAERLLDYYKLAHSIGLDVLVEVHNEDELVKALEAGADIIGINNRNLNDFTEDLYTTVRLAEKIPKGKIIVSESSIHTIEDIKVLKQASVDAILVGESFMRCDDIRKKAREFKEAYGK